MTLSKWLYTVALVYLVLLENTWITVFKVLFHVDRFGVREIKVSSLYMYLGHMTICSLCVLTICSISYFPFRF